jgi:hypothetical protein
MHVQVSLTIEIGASASIAEMERRMQAAGQQGMREAVLATSFGTSHTATAFTYDT